MAKISRADMISYKYAISSVKKCEDIAESLKDMDKNIITIKDYVSLCWKGYSGTEYQNTFKGTRKKVSEAQKCLQELSKGIKSAASDFMNELKEEANTKNKV